MFSRLLGFVKIRPVAVIVVAALLLRVLIFLSVANQYQFDSERVAGHLAADGYYQIAENLRQHGIFSLNSSEPLLPDSFRTPGYPLLLWLSLVVSGTVVPLVIVQIMAAGAILGLTARLAERIGVSGWVRICILLVLAIDPLGLSLSIKLLTEIFFTLFFLLGVEQVLVFMEDLHRTGVDRPWYKGAAFRAGAWFGIATLFRPTTMYFAIAFSVLWILYRLIRRVPFRLRSVALFFVVSTVPLVPWMVRNYLAFGVFSYSSAKEHVAYATLAPSILMRVEHRPYIEVQRDWFTSHGFSELPAPTVATAPWFKEKVTAVIKQHRREFAEVAGISVLTFFTHDGALDLLTLLHPNQKLAGMSSVLAMMHMPITEQVRSVAKFLSSPAAAVVVARMIWSMFALGFVTTIGYLVIRRRLTIGVAFFVLAIGYFSATTLTNGVAVNARFRFPVDSLLLIVVGAGVAAFGGRRAT